MMGDTDSQRGLSHHLQPLSGRLNEANRIAMIARHVKYETLVQVFSKEKKKRKRKKEKEGQAVIVRLFLHTGFTGKLKSLHLTWIAKTP